MYKLVNSWQHDNTITIPKNVLTKCNNNNNGVYSVIGAAKLKEVLTCMGKFCAMCVKVCKASSRGAANIL